MAYSPENDLKIRLSPLSGALPGTPERIAVDKFPFVIGRGDDCQLPLRRGSVSRKHCALIIQNDAVSIIDMGSRNGTIVEGSRLTGSESAPLSHNQTIRIGKVTLRVSIRNRLTNEPIVNPKLSNVSPLLSELDSLLNDIEQGNLTVGDSEEETETTAFVSDESEQRPKRVKTPRTTSSELEQDSTNTETIEIENDETTNQYLAGNANNDSSREANEGQELKSEDSGKPESGPKRLPDHLRKALTQDSQEAANDALKRLFGGR